MPQYIPRDQYFRKAKQEGYRARSVYKLKEIDNKLSLFKPHMRVLDLGACPGSWAQYAAPLVKEIVAIDLKQLKPFPEKNIITLTGDALKHQYEGKFSVILNDMMPNTTGIKDIDQKKSAELNNGVLKLAKRYLKKNGVVVSKILQGTGFDEFIKYLKKETISLKVLQVKASRKGSREKYLVYKLN